MATVPAITDGNTYADKTTDTPPIQSGEEPIRWGKDDANAVKARLAEHAAAINANVALPPNPHAASHGEFGNDPLSPAAIGAEVAPDVTTEHSDPTLTLSAAYRNQHTPLNTGSNGISIGIPDDLPPGFVWTGRKKSASNAVTFASGGGLITPLFRGQTTCTADDTDICVFVESATVARVYIVEASP